MNSYQFPITQVPVSMLPNSDTAKRLQPRKVFRGSHEVTIPSPEDPSDAPIVERMTRKRLSKMSPANARAWAEQSLMAIQSASATNEQESILKFMKRPTNDVGPSSDDAGPSSSPVTGIKKRKKIKRTPDTPPGVTPSKRDGAPGRALLCYSPWVWDSPP